MFRAIPPLLMIFALVGCDSGRNSPQTSVVKDESPSDEPAPAQPRPPEQVPTFDLKGILIGQPTTKTEIESKLGISCRSDEADRECRRTAKSAGMSADLLCGEKPMRYCQGLSTVGGQDANIKVHLTTGSDWIVRDIFVRFTADRFSEIRDAVLEKYGAFAHEQKVDRLHNAYGAEFEQFTYDWVAKDGTSMLLMSRNPSDLTEGVLAMISKDELDRQGIELTEAKKDL
jgi:hypothetical protein